MFEDAQLLLFAEVPDFDGVVFRGRHDVFFIGSNSYTADGISVGVRNFEDGVLCFGVPYLYAAVVVTGSDVCFRARDVHVQALREGIDGSVDVSAAEVPSFNGGIQ